MRTVKFPILSERTIKCPICEGKGCRVCEEGFYKFDGEVWVEVQQPLVIKYLKDNIEIVAKELNLIFGLTPKVTTEQIIFGHRIDRIDTTSGSIWVAFPEKGGKPRYFKTERGLKIWLASEK